MPIDAKRDLAHPCQAIGAIVSTPTHPAAGAIHDSGYGRAFRPYGSGEFGVRAELCEPVAILTQTIGHGTRRDGNGLVTKAENGQDSVPIDRLTLMTINIRHVMRSKAPERRRLLTTGP
jgi:hypothetical protein